MDKTPISDIMASTLQKVREMIDVNTVVGEPITTVDGITIIPVSKVVMGFAAGGSEYRAKTPGEDKPFGGGSGAGVTISPLGFLIVNNGNVRFITANNSSGAAEKAIEMAPELIDKIKDTFTSKN
ncbi:MAG: GerW family sporulation protein [Oscillospiraceae bacterium]|nr:GerW family sporulation protein [Oscillospiraceae bacterium]